MTKRITDDEIDRVYGVMQHLIPDALFDAPSLAGNHANKIAEIVIGERLTYCRIDGWDYDDPTYLDEEEWRVEIARIEDEQGNAVVLESRPVKATRRKLDDLKTKARQSQGDSQEVAEDAEQPETDDRLDVDTVAEELASQGPNPLFES